MRLWKKRIDIKKEQTLELLSVGPGITAQGEMELKIYLGVQAAGSIVALSFSVAEAAHIIANWQKQLADIKP